MQLALTNVGQTTFGQAKDEEMVRDTVDEEEAFSEEALSDQHSAFSQNQKLFTAKDAEDAKEEKGLPRNQNLFTTEGTEDTEKNQGLPLINTDVTDFGESGGEDGGEDVEFVPVPGGYGFERVRLRIKPELGGQRRPVRPAIIPEDPAQVHNSSLRDE